MPSNSGKYLVFWLQEEDNTLVVHSDYGRNTAKPTGKAESEETMSEGDDPNEERKMDMMVEVASEHPNRTEEEGKPSTGEEESQRTRATASMDQQGSAESERPNAPE